MKTSLSRGPEEYVRSQRVRVGVLQNEKCIRMMREFIPKDRPFGTLTLSFEPVDPVLDLDFWCFGARCYPSAWTDVR